MMCVWVWVDVCVRARMCVWMCGYLDVCARACVDVDVCGCVDVWKCGNLARVCGCGCVDVCVDV